jgi:hypothetical protein
MRIGRVRIAAMAGGLDPTVGYLHASRPGRVALVYDLMESLRPRVDRLVLAFLQSHTFAPSDVVLTEPGVCRLHPQLARAVAGLTVGDAAVGATVASMAQEPARATEGLVVGQPRIDPRRTYR